MILHTFEAQSTKEALREARTALGPAACILEVRRAKGRMRVVAAAERPGARPELPDTSSEPGQRHQHYSALSEALVSRGFSDAAASRLAAGSVVELLDPAANAAGRDSGLASALARWIRPAISLAPGEHECVAIVGPPGAGKTSLIAKRAARLAGADSGSLVLASSDRERLGGAEQLEAVARALGARFQLVRHREDLHALVARCAGRAHLFLDTQGISWSAPAALPEIVALLSTMRRGEIELLLPADLDGETMNETTRIFQALGPARVSVGRADLAFRPGVVLSLLMSLGLPLESVSIGPRIPQDLEDHPLEGLARLAFSGDSIASARFSRPAESRLPHSSDTAASTAHQEVAR